MYKVFVVVVNWERVHIFHWLSVACMTQNKIKNDVFVLIRRREKVHLLLVSLWRYLWQQCRKKNRLWEDHSEAAVIVQVEMLTKGSSSQKQKKKRDWMKGPPFNNLYASTKNWLLHGCSCSPFFPWYCSSQLENFLNDVKLYPCYTFSPSEPKVASVFNYHY